VHVVSLRSINKNDFYHIGYLMRHRAAAIQPPISKRKLSPS
jgi:hypothetical protein